MGQPRRATTFSVTIPPEMAEAVYQQVKQGIHGSAGAVIREALRLMLKFDEDGAPPPPPPEGQRHRQRGGSRMRSD